MARVFHYAAVTWARQGGLATAVVAEEPKIYATRNTVTEALQDLQEYMTWLFKQEPWMDGPELEEARLTTVMVKVRAQHQAGNRIFPVDPPLTARFPCVYGPHASGLLLASLPTLSLQFLYQEGRDLKELVQHYVQDVLAGMSPDELLRHLPPHGVELTQITVRARRQPERKAAVPLDALEAVADRLIHLKTRAYPGENLIAQLTERLRDQRASVLMVGPSGVGKTAILLEVARRNRKLILWRTSAARLIAGMRYLGQWEERCEQVVAELGRIKGILCVENLLELCRAGGSQPTSSVANFLSGSIERGELQVVAEATPEEIEAIRRLLPGLVDLFQLLPVPEPRPRVAEDILYQVGMLLEQQFPVKFDPGVEREIYRVFARFSPYTAFPGAAVVFMRELAERCQRVDRAAVLRSFARRTGLPEIFLRDELPLPAEQVLADLSGQVVGQPAACRVAADLVTTFKAAMNDRERPLGVLLFCGPTGVGKTELARALARTFFSGEERLIRLDMSEYAGFGAAERLLGHLSGQPSKLVRELRRQPFAVVLLDEIEKAHPEVFDVLLRVMDEGRLTDVLGRPTWFRSAVLVMTSNLGAESLRQVGLTPRSEEGHYAGAAQSFFRPEFYNRIDALVQFDPLSPGVIRELARKEVAALEKRQGLERRGLKLVASEQVLDLLAHEGYEHRYGARPLQRAVESRVVKPLSTFLLAHPRARKARLILDLVQGEVQASLEPASTPSPG